VIAAAGAFVAQAAVEAAKTGGGFFAGTGTFVLDGAILIAILKIVEAGINKIRHRGNGKKMPCPGEAQTCRDHGESIAALMEFKESADGSLKRIEGKVDQILMIRGGK
jgi:hypothetical protein